MADSRIDPPVIPVPKNWEEMEHAFSSLQRWTNELTTQLNVFRSETTRKQVASTPQLLVGQVGFSSILFFGEGSAVWTVQETDIERFNYVRLGQLVFIDFDLYTTAISTDTSGSLFIRLYGFDMLPGRQQTAGVTASPYLFGGSLYWNDIANSTTGIGLVSAVGQNFDTATRSMILQLDRCSDGTSASSMFTDWAISTNLHIGGHCWFITSPSNVPVI